MDEKELDKMAKDIEPVEEPKETTTTEAPVGFVEDKETYVKPDGETTTAPVRTPNVIKEESGKGKWVFGGLMTLFILGLGASTAWLYTDAQNTRNELQSVKTGLEAARADAAKLRADATDKDKQQAIAPELTVDEEIQLAASNYYCATTDLGCDKTAAKVDKKQAVITGKPGYAVVSLSGVGAGTKLLLKSINEDKWIVIFDSKDAETPDANKVKRFNIPEDFVKASEQ